MNRAKYKCNRCFISMCLKSRSKQISRCMSLASNGLAERSHTWKLLDLSEHSGLKYRQGECENVSGLKNTEA